MTRTRRALPQPRLKSIRPFGLTVRGLILPVLIAATLASPMAVSAQGAVEARIASVSGPVFILGKARAAFAATRGRVLAPGDEIDTRSGGQAIISLTDGSQVVVQPGSLVVLKDYRAASSLRELLEILAGRVRIKINHFGGRPNPYRVNSPTASIAVRGTELDVTVEANGETQVMVYEGLVEVASLRDPSHMRLVEPGRSIIVRPNGDVRFLSQSVPNNSKVSSWASSRATTGDAAEAYERDLGSVVTPGDTPFVSRFAAFADAHLDSLSNPAYASEFTAIDGRVFLLPSFSRPRGPQFNAADYSLGSAHPVDRSFSPQVSLFIPLPKFNTVVGGSYAYSHRNLQSLGMSEVPGSFFSPAQQRATADSTTNTYSTGSLIMARRFGADGRTSIGLGVDRFVGSGSFQELITLSEKGRLRTRENLESESHAARTRFTLGFTRDLPRGTKLGLSYRYGMTEASDSDILHTSDGKPLALDATLSAGHSSELGLWLRGPITSRLFYGVEGTMLFTNVDAKLKRAVFLNSHESDNAKRSTLGVGIGYVLRQRTLLGFDVTGGTSSTDNWWREDTANRLLEAQQQRTKFWSLHAAVQTDIWRGLFASASILTIAQSRTTDLMLYPDRFGRRLTAEGLFAPTGQTREGSAIYYSRFGAGWRLSSSFLAEYVFSTDYGRTSPSHILLLRYTFGTGNKQ